jgi:hypothetical protein
VDCVLLIAIAVTAPVSVGIGVVVAEKVEWGWALLGAIFASVALTNALAGSLLTDADWARIIKEVGSDQFSFLGRWLAALGTVCSPLLTALGVGVGAAIGVTLGERAKAGS